MRESAFSIKHKHKSSDVSSRKNALSNNINREGEARHFEGGRIQESIVDVLNVRCLLDIQVAVASRQLPVLKFRREVWVGVTGL